MLSPEISEMLNQWAGFFPLELSIKCDTVSLSRPDFLMEPYGFPVYPVILTVWGCPAGLFSCFCASGYVFHMILRPVPDSKMREDVVK